jgi:hypothetical protein
MQKDETILRYGCGYGLAGELVPPVRRLGAIAPAFTRTGILRSVNVTGAGSIHFSLITIHFSPSAM